MLRALPLPIFLRITGRDCLVVGGGSVAWPKTALLLDAGAKVTMVAPVFAAPPAGIEGHPELTREQRAFTAADLIGRFLVIAATDDRSVQAEVRRGADARGILCNVVDEPSACDFIFGATLRRGDLTLSISTAGSFPLVAQRLRDRWARRLDAGAGEALARLALERTALHSDGPATYDERRRRLARLLDDDILDALEQGDLERIEAAIRRWREEAGS